MDEHSGHAADLGPGFDPDDPSLFATPPIWPKVVGILSIVFGTIAVLCGGLGGLSGAAFGPMVEPQLNGAPIPPHMQFSLLLFVFVGASVALNVTLIVAGVLTIKRQMTGRAAHLLYALLMVPLSFATTWWQLGLQKRVIEWAETYPDNPIAQQTMQQQSMGVNFALIGAVVGVVLTLAWPVFCLIWFGLVKTRKHHWTGGEPTTADGEFDPMSV